MHFDLTDVAGMDALPALRPRAAAGAGRARGASERRRSEVARAAQLRERAHRARHRYYVLDDPEIGDDEYDALLDELRAHRGRASRAGHARTRRPSASAASRSAALEKVAPPASRCCRWPTRAPRRSCAAWIERMRNHLAREGIEDPEFQYVAEPKIDGLAISLRLPRRRAASAAPRAATARSARTSPTTCARSPTIPLRIDGDDAPAAARGPRRGLHVAGRLRRAQRAPRRGGAVDVHEPAQLRRGDDPPARPQARRRAPAVDVGLRRRRDRGHLVRQPLGCAAVAARARLPRQRRRRAARPPRTRSSRAAWRGRSAAASSTSRSTASWSRSTTSSCSAGWASSGATRAGRSPGSSRRRRRSRG